MLGVLGRKEVVCVQLPALVTQFHSAIDNIHFNWKMVLIVANP